MSIICGKYPHEHSLEGAGNAATSKLMREMGFSKWTRNEQVDNPGLRRATRTVADYTRALVTDHVILNHGQVTWTTPELAPPLLTTTPHQGEEVSALDRFNVHRCPTRRVFSGTGLELVTKQATVRYLYHSATAAPSLREIVNNTVFYDIWKRIN
ncbi:uncharacterized protein TNCV_1685981 [Trichonephila clavipes]|nr:uncharacterized protein TNCV_1685981 [Trichonephila clavipes]